MCDEDDIALAILFAVVLAMCGAAYQLGWSAGKKAAVDESMRMPVPAAVPGEQHARA